MLTRVRFPAAASEFSPSVNFQCRLSFLRCPHSAPPVQSHPSYICEHVKNPNTDSYAIIWTHENTAHTGRNGYSPVFFGKATR